MRRLDKLLLKAFIGPFFLTTGVATFILLIQYMLKYFDDFVGKDLGFAVFAELIFYFSLNMLQVALPLGVLVSSLMTFGNLGENFELTAIKSAGISLIRAMRPLFFFVVLISIGAFFFNNRVVPAANLKAYSLLYDIKHTKPALDIKAGVFYNGIPNYSIKVAEKLSDNKTLLDVIIYDHTERNGNKRVILADSSKMYTIFNDKFLKLELYSGWYFIEQDKPRSRVDQFYRTSYDRMELVFPLSSFDLKRTKEELFRNNRQMKDIAELSSDIDSISSDLSEIHKNIIINSSGYLKYSLKDLSGGYLKQRQLLQKEKELQLENDGKIEGADDKNEIDEDPDDKVQEASFISLFSRIFDQKDKTLQKQPAKKNFKLDTTKFRKILPKTVTEKESFSRDSITIEWLDQKISDSYRDKSITIGDALRNARNFKVNLNSQRSRKENLTKEKNKYSVEKYKKYSQAFACIVMFLIGAPLGAIIKKGGLGVPVIIGIFFFIIYYVITITSEKWAKADLVDPSIAVWSANILLFPIGLFFLRQARIDARLFDADFYSVVADKLKNAFQNKRK